jgi:hypothetical protein
MKIRVPQAALRSGESPAGERRPHKAARTKDHKREREKRSRKAFFARAFDLPAKNTPLSETRRAGRRAVIYET